MKHRNKTPLWSATIALAAAALMTPFAATALEDKLVIGDDMFATNIKRIQKGIAHGAANATLCTSWSS